MTRRRLGLFGGTFDPVHHGHLIVAAEAFAALDLHLLLFVPAADPPHKASVTASAEQRVRMLEAAIDGDARFAVDTLEMERGGVSYTVDTLRAIHAREPEAELFFLLGTDQYRELAAWKEPDEIARLANLAVLRRGRETGAGPESYQAVGVPSSRIDISATEVRHRVAAGKSVRYFVPDKVDEIIRREGLYKS